MKARRRTFDSTRHRLPVILVLLSVLSLGCARLRLPAIDPVGRSVFLPAPNSTRLLTSPNAALTNQPPQAAASPLFQPPSFSPAPQYPVQPAFQTPATPPPCDQPIARNDRKYLIPDPTGSKSPGRRGQIIMTPSRIVAPVGSEVVVLAGVCGGDGFFVKNQPLEWMLSNNSVGELVEVGGQQHKTFNRLIPPTAKKFSGQYAWGRTGLKKVVLSRGTPTPIDDIELAEGQTFVSVASASPGTSYVTAVAPKAEGWDKRRASTVIHWVDGNWSIPVPSSATAGTVFPLTTVVNRTDGSGLKGWNVRYSIVGGAPAEFAPAGSQKAEATTDADGKATVQIRQPAGQFDPGVTQVRVDVVRPPVFGEPELVVESGITSVSWTAPALTIRAVGPRQTDTDTPFNYRVEVSNPGDQVARGVVVRTKSLDDSIEFISSTPKPTEYGRNYEWQLGEIVPGAPPKLIEIQLKSQKRGNVNMCFEVISETDRLSTEVCAQTEVALPCIGLTIEGPSQGQVGREAAFNVTVENQCNEPLENIRIGLRHDPGLLRPGKPNPTYFDYPLLQFGESRTLPIRFNIEAEGQQCFVVEVTADNIRPQVARKCIEVGGVGSADSSVDPGTTPLRIEVSEPPAIRVGEKATVRVQVTNRGSEPLTQITLINRSSPSIQPTDISNEFNPTAVGEELWVPISRIDPGQTIALDINYLGLQVDPVAVTEFSATTPSGAQAVGSSALRVNPENGSAPGSNVPNLNGGPIGIPPEQNPAEGEGATSQNLDVRVQSLDGNIRVGQRGRFLIEVTNNLPQSIRDVEVDFLVPNSMQLVDFNSEQNGLILESNPGGEGLYEIRKALELRSGEKLSWTAIVEGRLVGQATLEARARSFDVVGASTASDSMIVEQ